MRDLNGTSSHMLHIRKRMDWKQILLSEFKDRESDTGYHPISFEDYITRIIGDKPLWEYEGFKHLEPKEVSSD